MTPRVVGVTIVRDEWPLVGLSVSHALLRHVDDVLLLDHASDPANALALSRLKRHWGDRLHIVRLDLPRFFQEAMMNALMKMPQVEAADWLYVFDADEFGLDPDGGGLKAALAHVSPEVAAARYDVVNFVPPRDMDDEQLSAYLRIRHRAVANHALPVREAWLAREIADGHVNYYDIPFASKLVVRTPVRGRLVAGTHTYTAPDGTALPEQTLGDFRVAHVPMLSRRRLDLKVRQGLELQRSGFSAVHGWQSQMLVQLASERRLDEFWRRHSTSDQSPIPGSPALEPDDRLSTALQPAVDVVQSVGDAYENGQAEWRTTADAAFAAACLERLHEALADLGLERKRRWRLEASRKWRLSMAFWNALGRIVPRLADRGEAED